MGMHAYQLLESGEIIPRHEAGLKQVRDEGWFPSVTTKLKLPSSEFLDGWRQRKAILYTQQNPKLPNESQEDYEKRIDYLVWQPRVRWDGVEFSSNDFGTQCHAELEKWHEDQSYEFHRDWEFNCHGWPDTFRHHFSSVVEGEMMVACRLLKVAGTVDLLAIEQVSGMYALCDFKFRPHEGKPETKARDKDCQQLALEADIIRRKMGLSYLPNCYTAIGCVDTGSWHVKLWSDKMVQKHLQNALSVNLAYNVINGFETLEEAMESTRRVLAGEA